MSCKLSSPPSAATDQASAFAVIRCRFIGVVRPLVALIALTALYLAGAAVAQIPAGSGAERLNTPVHDAPRLSTQASTALPNLNCSLIVPENPLSAAGLVTPYELTATDPLLGPCHEAEGAQSAFVQAAIFDPATGTIAIYSPLVIDKGTRPALPPVVPTLPRNAVVAIWFGYNGENLTLRPAAVGALLEGRCVNGARSSVFGQFAYCNAPAFFKAANAAVASGQLNVPPLGAATDGRTCPTVRDFLVVDQDQSDNLPTSYLATSDGRTAQHTQKNLAALAGATPLGNPSDNRLLDLFVDPALGCSAWTAPDLTDPGQRTPALALNELQARAEQPTPVALIPGGDPMALLFGNEDRLKVNEYRLGVDQPRAFSDYHIDTARYCRQLLRTAPRRLLSNKSSLSAFRSPDPATADSLYTFMVQRFVASYQILDCASLTGRPDPVSFQTDSSGLVISATVDTNALESSIRKLAPFRAEDDFADSHAASQRTSE
jgi:hypothetical protein